MKTKACYRCREEKLVDEFGMNKFYLTTGARDGRSPYCKGCINKVVGQRRAQAKANRPQKAKPIDAATAARVALARDYENPHAQYVHNWRCRCLPCRLARAEYCEQWREGKRLLVPAEPARQLLLTFEDAKDAARVLKMPHNTIWRIRTGDVKKIRRTTALRIYEGLAA